MPCGFPSFRHTWTRCDRPPAFRSVTTHAPSCTGLRSASRQPCATSDPAASGLSNSHGGGDVVAAASFEAGSAFRAFGSATSPAAGIARAEATPVNAPPAAVKAAAAVAPTAALLINSRREIIVPSSTKRDARRWLLPACGDLLVCWSYRRIVPAGAYHNRP